MNKNERIELMECENGYTIYDIGNQGCGSCELFTKKGYCEYFKSDRLYYEITEKLTYCKDCKYAKILTKDDKDKLNPSKYGWEIECKLLKIFRKFYTDSCNKGELKND